MKRSLGAAAVLIGLALCLSTAAPAPAQILLGGNGGHTLPNGQPLSVNDGWLVRIDQATGAVTPVGHPGTVARISGLAFDPAGALFASTLPGGGFPPPPPLLTSDLIKINPATGALLSTIGPITAGVGGPAISIADLAMQPGTGALFGVQSSGDGLNTPGRLYTINKTTGVATLVGDTGFFFASLAFAPDGTLYEATADFAGMGPINPALHTLDPANGAVLSTVSTADFLGALGVRYSDGAIFGGTGDGSDLFRVNPTTGAETLIGTTGLNFVGDLDFATPEPGPTALLAGLGALGALLALRRRRA